MTLLPALALVAAGGAAGSATIVALAGTGVLGGDTIFSTTSYDAVRLARSGRRSSSLSDAVGTMLATAAAAGLGLWLAGRPG